MKYNLSCDIVKDLMPSYIDELVSESSKDAVEEHMASCDNCRNIYMRMSGKELEPSAKEEQAEIDFLKKNKKAGRRKVILAVLATILAVLLLFGYKGYIAGKLCDPALISYELSVNGTDVAFDGNMIEPDQGVKSVGYVMDENGTLDIQVKTTGASPLYKNAFESTYTAEKEIKNITVNGSEIIWSEGQYISPKVSEIFNKRHEFVGNMPENMELAAALGLPDILGSYSNELQTEKEPYGWKLAADNDFTEAEAKALEERIKPYFVILLSSVDNLEYMELTYTCDGVKKSMKMTLKDANEYVGKKADVKKSGESAAGLQKLVEELPILDFRFSSGNLGLYLGGDLNFELENQADGEVYGIGVSVLVNGEVKSSGGTCNADGSAFSKGDLGSMAIAAENEINDVDQDVLSVHVDALDAEGNSIGGEDISLGTIAEMKEAYSGQYDRATGMFNFRITLVDSEDGTFGVEFE